MKPIDPHAWGLASLSKTEMAALAELANVRATLVQVAKTGADAQAKIDEIDRRLAKDYRVPADEILGAVAGLQGDM